MRKLLAVSLALNAILVAIISWKSLVAEAAGGSPVLLAVRNGDVNGDGRLDISDAIHLLGWLFQGGSSPVPVGASPATGQSHCFNDTGDEIDCSSNDFPGQDGFFQAGCPKATRFFDNNDGTITDTCTGLMWIKMASDKKYNWKEALQFCRNLRFAGYTDWRLPNIKELEGIIDYDEPYFHLDPAFFPFSEADFWSSTTTYGRNAEAWGVQLTGGFVWVESKARAMFVFPVRGGL